MKVSRRMQRQVELKIRHALANELPHAEAPMTASGRLPQIEKTREENGSSSR
jgi:hypothetical protein